MTLIHSFDVPDHCMNDGCDNDPTVVFIRLGQAGDDTNHGSVLCESCWKDRLILAYEAQLVAPEDVV